MFKIRFPLVLITIILITTSCSQKLQIKDFTKEKSFTEGIEGPATDHEGNIYAVNFGEQGTIGKVSSNGNASLFVNLPNGSIGNGIRFGSKNKIYVADYTNHNVLEIDIQSKKIKIFAHESEANQPNDLAISPSKTLYASDPNWSESTGNIWKITKENGFELLEDNMGTTNGIEVSPNGKKLYVNESVQRKIWVYDIDARGDINNKQLFYSFDDHGLDGMRCDDMGNLYICRYGKGTVIAISPSGQLIKEIKVKGQKPSNLTFSNDYKTIYVTVADRGCLEVISNW